MYANPNQEEDFLFSFETEHGMEVTYITASCLQDATRQLKKNYPDEIGADGFVTFEDGSEQPINW